MQGYGQVNLTVTEFWSVQGSGLFSKIVGIRPRHVTVQLCHRREVLLAPIASTPTGRRTDRGLSRPRRDQ